LGKRFIFVKLALPSNLLRETIFKLNWGLMLIVYIATGALLLGGTLIIGSNLLSQRGRK